MVYLDLHFLFLEENQVLMSKQEELKIERGQLISYSKCEIVNVFYLVLPKSRVQTTHQYKMGTTITMCLWFWEPSQLQDNMPRTLERSKDTEKLYVQNMWQHTLLRDQDGSKHT